MKGFYILSQHDTACRLIRGHGTPYGEKWERIHDARDLENRAAFTGAFQALKAGKIDLFYTSYSQQSRSGEYIRNYVVYHRSPKNAGMIQESHYFTRGNNPDVIACYDCQHATAADALREGVKSGAYITKGGTAA